MKKRNILVFLGHPMNNCLCSGLADAYEQGAKTAGHMVTRINIGDLSFDPILHKGYHEIQELEPDLKKAQEAIRAAEHIVFVYPTWWGGMPALFKGFFDRVWLPGFAFHAHKGRLYGWDKLLKGKTARVITTVNAPPWLERLFLGNYTNELKRGILEYAGISTKVTAFGPSEHSSDKKRASWIAYATKLGKWGC